MSFRPPCFVLSIGTGSESQMITTIGDTFIRTYINIARFRGVVSGGAEMILYVCSMFFVNDSDI